MDNLKEIQKALKEKVSECETLKKKVEKFERDKLQWENQKRILESKQPMNVQVLQNEKRELTMQLDREQSEKQELFLQINSLIAKLAEVGQDNSDLEKSDSIKNENNALKEQIKNIQEIQAQLNVDVQNLQEEIRRKTNEVESVREELKRLENLLETERNRWEDSAKELERELERKSAALQSLLLAKQDYSNSESDWKNLKLENEKLRKEVEVSCKESKSKSSEIEINQKSMKDLEEKLCLLENQLKDESQNAIVLQQEATAQSNQLLEKTEQIIHLEKRINVNEKLNNELKLLVDEKDSSLKTLKEEICLLERQLKEETQNIFLQQQTVTDKNNELLEKIERVNLLERRTSDAEKLNDELKTIINEKDASLKILEEKLFLRENQLKRESENVNDQQQKISLKSNELLEKIEVINHLEECIQSNEKFTDQLKLSIEEKDSSLSKKDDELKMLITELENERVKSRKYRDSFDQIARESDDKTALEIGRLREELEEDSKKIIEMQSKISFMDENDAKMQKLLSQKEDGITRAQEDLNTLRAKVLELENELDDVKEERKFLLNDVEVKQSDFDLKVKNLQLQLEKAQSTLEMSEQSSKETIDELEEGINNMVDKINSAEVEKQDFCKKIVVMENELQRLSQIILESESKLSSMSVEKEKLNSLNAELLFKLEQLTDDSESSQKSIKNEVLSLTLALQRIRAENEEKVREIGGLQKQIQQIQDEHDTESLELRSHIDELENSLDFLKENCAIWEKKATTCENEFDSLKLTHIQKESELTKIIDDMKLKIKKLEESNEITKLEYEKFKHENEMLTDFVEKERRRVEDLNANLTNISMEYEKQSSIEKAACQESLENELKELMAENAKLAAELLKEQTRYDREFANEKTKMENEFKQQLDEREKSLKKEVEAKEGEKYNALAARETEFVKKLRLESSELQAVIDRELKTNNSLTKELEDVRKNFISEKEDKNRLSNELNELRKQFEELQYINEQARRSKQIADLSEGYVSDLKKSISDMDAVDIRSIVSDEEIGAKQPEAPPRIRRFEADSNDPQYFSGLEDENKKLRIEIEGQLRVIKVLRRKLRSATRETN